MKDKRLELYEHMVDCAPENAGFNEVQKPYILEYMQRYSDLNNNKVKDKIIEILMSETFNTSDEAGNSYIVTSSEDFDDIAERIVKFLLYLCLASDANC